MIESEERFHSSLQLLAIYEKEFLTIKRQNIAPDYFFEMEERKIQFHRKEDIDE
ncbi:hypothetical protein QUG02_02375 [Bacillus hominis]|uniref:Fur-regulated basic protein FbpA n=1 Tax=Bacillus hominis TaxID=2817478 RepID=A0ABT7R292_9BACI|nr:hypothetical protein [Bacillus hominis]MDM5191861.1 hypothetical protein [Bacillus hominis]MDM5431592.1 hypothetical protein [Bacillus hominis]MDM5437028.1 hypothetical protein [Bacillus hominis]